METFDIHVCESCTNMISIPHDQEKIFICPACGTINERSIPQEVIGHLEIVSPEFNCEVSLNDDEGGQVVVKDVDIDFEDALAILTKYGFSIKFVKHKDKED